jgi:hypothetical protein
MFDPYITHFIQPDSIIPDPSNPQSLNRYEYARNNPVRYNDPTGHCAGPNNVWIPDGTSYCSSKGEGISAEDDPIISLDADIPETPMPTHEAVTIGTNLGQDGTGCHEASYADCFYNREDFLITKPMKVDDKQFIQLTKAVYHDISIRPNSASDRTRYDTPFWDLGHYPGDVCFDNGKCYQNHEVNYFAQGMWSAVNGQSLKGGIGVVNAWKWANHYVISPSKYPSSTPSEGTIHWFTIGYFLAKAFMADGQ